MKPFIKIASVLVGIGGLIHLRMIVISFRIMFGNFEVLVVPVICSLYRLLFSVSVSGTNQKQRRLIEYAFDGYSFDNSEKTD